MTATPDADAQLSALKKEREEFAQRVRENESLAARDPEAYKRKLKNLVMLGYAYIAGMALLAIALLVVLVLFAIFGHHLGGGVVKIGILLLVFVGAILRSLWVKIDPPEGYLLSKERFPKLWMEVEAIADRLKAPRPDEIRLDEEFNASAAQWPRFGIFGGYRQTLTLGLPLLAGLSPDEARGVIAHEFGHFSGAHGRFGVWIYRVDQTWRQLGENLSRSSGANLFKPFVNWFFPRFAATSFAIRRQHEYEADRAAAEVVGAPTVARTLARLSPLGDHLRRTFTDPFFRELTRTGSPSSGYSSGLITSMKRPMDRASMERRVAFTLAQKTDYDDTHPSLADRLASLGQPMPDQLPEAADTSAAEAFFGDGLQRLTEEFDAYYMERLAPGLQAIATRRTQMTGRVGELERREAVLSEKEHVELGYLRAELSASEDPIPAYRELVARFPESPDAAYILGSALLEKDEEEGVALVEFAAANDAQLQNDARGDLAGFYARRGEAERVERLREEAQEAHDRSTIAESATALKLDDELLAPELTALEREKLVELLKKLKGLGQAFVFRKRMPGTGELRNYLLLVAKKTAFTGDDTMGYFTGQLAKLGEPPFPLTVAVVPKPKEWQKRLETLPQAEVFNARDKD